MRANRKRDEVENTLRSINIYAPELAMSLHRENNAYVIESGREVVAYGATLSEATYTANALLRIVKKLKNKEA